MKKAIAMLLTAMLVLSLTACAATTTPDSDTPADNSAPVTGTDETGTASDTGTADGESADAAQLQALCDTLDAIDVNTITGTAGSSLRAIQSAGTLLDWAAATTLSEDDIQSCVAGWLMDKGNDEQVAFAAKMSAVDESMQDLQGETAADMLSSAGYESANYPWNDAAYGAADVVMAAVGLR